MAQRHHVCYEVWPHYASVDGLKVQVGFNVELCAAQGSHAEHLTPCGRPSLETFDDLRQIARYILPENGNDAEFEILPYDHGVHESPKRGFRPEVVLSLQILHRHGFNQPVDPCEERCLRQMENRLKQLAVRKAN